MATILAETSATLIDGNSLIKGKLSISDSLLLFTRDNNSVSESYSYNIIVSNMTKGQQNIRTFF